ncbi:hypothetical protein OG21DRAFT_1269825 [Imleria badia]|nr:hypothetical protein OG21DRAFT_1269825 [Imleria badia]
MMVPAKLPKKKNFSPMYYYIAILRGPPLGRHTLTGSSVCAANSDSERGAFPTSCSSLFAHCHTFVLTSSRSNDEVTRATSNDSIHLEFTFQHWFHPVCPHQHFPSRLHWSQRYPTLYRRDATWYLVDRFPWLKHVPGYGRRLKSYHESDLKFYRGQLSRVECGMVNSPSHIRTVECNKKP